MTRAASLKTDLLDEAPDFALERTSGVFFRVRRVPSPGELTSVVEIGRRVQQTARTWAAIYLAPSFRVGARASVLPEPSRAHPKGSPLVARLAAWLPRAGDETCELDVPAYVRPFMPVERALIVPVQTMATLGWLAVPAAIASPALARHLEAFASGVGLALEAEDRRERLRALAGAL